MAKRLTKLAALAKMPTRTWPTSGEPFFRLWFFVLRHPHCPSCQASAMANLPRCPRCPLEAGHLRRALIDSQLGSLPPPALPHLCDGGKPRRCPRCPHEVGRLGGRTGFAPYRADQLKYAGPLAEPTSTLPRFLRELAVLVKLDLFRFLFQLPQLRRTAARNRPSARWPSPRCPRQFGHLRRIA